jgi:hypothetical protein
VQVDPIKPKLEPPGTKRLKPKCDIPVSTSAFKFNLRRYSQLDASMPVEAGDTLYLPRLVGRCQLTLSKSR